MLIFICYTRSTRTGPKLRDLGVREWAKKAIADGRFGHLGFSFHDDCDIFKQIVDDYDWTPVHASDRARSAQGRVVSLMRWLDGRHFTAGFRPHHAQAMGRVMAQLHRFAAGWRPSKGFKRPHWDWDGQFGERELHDTDELVASMPQQFQEPFRVVTRQVREVMDLFGKGPDAYGMIHADMYLENVLFKAGEPRPIDFEDCGFSYWMCDIGTFLSQWPWTEDFPRIQDAFLDGYAQVRTLPDEQLKHLDLFMAGQYAQLLIWASAFIRHDPARRTQHEAWRNREGNNLLRYFMHC
jgi:Ser/Thr protein kinase RdoA (MazF antagonist)